MDNDEKRKIVADCRELVVSLTFYTDRGENDAAVGLFTPEGTWVRGGKPLTGHAMLLADMNGRDPALIVRHMPAITHVDVVDADNAKAVTYYAAYNGKADSVPPQPPLPLDPPFSLGEWHDRFVRSPEGWRIAHRETKRLFQRRA